MSPAPHTPDHDLARVLRTEADRFAQRGGSSLDLEQVVHRAGEIRRGRRMRATIAMAAVVLAVAVPVGINALNDSPLKKDDQVATDPPDTDPISITGLKTGKAPATGWYADGKLYSLGPVLPLGAGDAITNLAKLDDAFLIGTYDETAQEIVASVLDPDGRNTKTWPMASGFAVSADGRTGAFVQPDGRVVAVGSAGGSVDLGTVPGAAGSGYDALAVSGDCATSCTAIVASTAADPTVWSIDQDGEVTDLDTGLQSVRDVDGSRFAGVTRVNDDDMSTCSAVTEGGAELWTTCPGGAASGKRLDAFSPDGKHLLAIGSIGSGEGESELAILDADDGTVVLDLKTAGWGTEEQGVIRQLMWEDDTHVLALVREADEFAVVRIALNGERELALGVEKGVDFDTSPFLLPVG